MTCLAGCGRPVWEPPLCFTCTAVLPPDLRSRYDTADWEVEDDVLRYLTGSRP